MSHAFIRTNNHPIASILLLTPNPDKPGKAFLATEATENTEGMIRKRFLEATL
jgi:hypothetical protein